MLLSWCTNPKMCLARSGCEHTQLEVASSWALAQGIFVDFCRAAGWATPNTFARFYSLRVDPVSSCVLALISCIRCV